MRFSLLFFLSFSSFTCNSQSIYDSLNTIQKNTSALCKPKYHNKQNLLIDVGKMFELNERLDSMNYDIAFIEQSVNGKDSNIFSVTEWYYIKADSSHFLIFHNGKQLTNYYDWYPYLTDFDEINRKFEKKPVKGPIDYPKKKIYRHGCIRPSNEYINSYKKDFAMTIQTGHKIFSKIIPSESSFEVKIEYPPKNVNIKWSVEGGKF